MESIIVKRVLEDIRTKMWTGLVATLKEWRDIHVWTLCKMRMRQKRQYKKGGKVSYSLYSKLMEILRSSKQ